MKKARSRIQPAMKQEKPLPIAGAVVFLIGGVGLLLGLLTVYPLAKQVSKQATGLTIFLPLVAFGVTIAAAIVTEYLLRRNADQQLQGRKRELERVTAWWEQDLSNNWDQQLINRLQDSPLNRWQQGLANSEGMELLRQRVREDLQLLVSTSPPSQDAVADLQRQLAALTERLEKQKNETVEVHKIDPVLEATLKGSIENLAKRIETLEKKQLEKWDVALVCFQLLGSIGALILVGLGVAKYVLGK